MSSSSGRTGRPNHMTWLGFDKVYTPAGRTAAKCHNCQEILANTGRTRLIKHKQRCELINPTKEAVSKKTTNEMHEVRAWIEPKGADWTGFRQSVLPNVEGMFFAQCKKCLVVMEAVVSVMAGHKDDCLGKPFLDTEVVYTTDENQDDLVEVDEEHGSEKKVPHGKGTEEFFEEEEILKHETPPAVKKIKVTIPSSAAKYLTPLRPVISTAPSSSTARQSTAGCAYCEKPRKSVFEEIAKIWAMKLDDLPLEQALGIEKKMSDMLYEATLTHLQAQAAADSRK